MSSSIDFDSDAAYARQLQDEEIRSARSYHPSAAQVSSAGSSGSQPPLVIHPSGRVGDEQAQPSNLPLLARAMSVPVVDPNSREVHQNAAAQAQQIQDNSITLLSIYCCIGLIELIMSIVVLSQGWNQECERPLRAWIIIYSSRWLALIPLAITRFRRRYRVYSEFHPDQLMRIQNWVKLAAFVWMIVGQYWYFTSHCDSSSPWLSRYTLTLIILFYVGLFLPIILLMLMCLCLPCVLLFLQIFQTAPGAAPDVINSLPKRTYHPGGDSNSDRSDNESCAICMEDYKDGDELRHLPACNHEFHMSCVDKWLRLNHSCPLCRRSILPNDQQQSEAQSQSGASPQQSARSDEMV